MPKDSQPALTPKLRFPEFRNGPDWEAHPLSSLTSLSKGDQLDASDKDVDGLYPHYNGGISPSSFTHKHNRKANTIIISEGGNSCGYVQFIRQPFWSGGHCYSLEPRPHVNTLALFYALQAKQREIMALRIGSGLPNIQKSTLLKFELSFPILESEQQKIAECLSTLDELIEAESRKLDALKDHKKGLMQQLFPREGETRPRLRFPEFQSNDEWRTVPLSELLREKPVYGANAPAVPYSETLPTYLRITDIDDDGRFIRANKVSVAIIPSEDNFLRLGDIVLARTGASVGKSYQYKETDGDLVFAGFLIRLRPHPEKVVSTYLFNFLRTDRYWNWVRITSARSGQPGINSAEYSALPIPMPPDGDIGLAEQQRIADCLSSVDDLIAVQSEKLESLRTHKCGLMQQLFPNPSEFES